MEASGRQKATLAVLVAILAVTVWVQLNQTPGRAPELGATPVARAPQGAADEALAGVRLDLLEVASAGEGAARNPFEFARPPVQAPALMEAPSAVEVPATPMVPVVPAIPLAYIGRIDLPGGDGRVAVFSDNRGHVFQGREGDVIEGRYRVLRVGLESTDVARLDGTDLQTLELSDR